MSEQSTRLPSCPAASRREWLGGALSVCAAWAWPEAVQAQAGKMVRIGVTKIVSHAALDADAKGFEAWLARAGFKDGVNVTYLRRDAGGDMARSLIHI